MPGQHYRRDNRPGRDKRPEQVAPGLQLHVGTPASQTDTLPTIAAFHFRDGLPLDCSELLNIPKNPYRDRHSPCIPQAPEHKITRLDSGQAIRCACRRHSRLDVHAPDEKEELHNSAQSPISNDCTNSLAGSTGSTERGQPTSPCRCRLVVPV